MILEVLVATALSLVPLPKPATPASSAAARALQLLPEASSTSGLARPARPTAPSEDWIGRAVPGAPSKSSIADATGHKPRDPIDPLPRTAWKTEESLKLPFSRTFFLVGRVGANSASLEQQQYKVIGTTGIGIRLPLGGEFQMRRGRSKTNYDPDDLVLVPGQAKDFVEVTTRWTLPGEVKLEYTQESIVPQTPLDREMTKRDVRLAYPLPHAGQIHIGAKYQSAESATAPWLDRMKLYFGLQLLR